VGAVRQSELISIKTAFARVAVDAGVGNLRELNFAVRGQTLVPLHTAPWLDEPADTLPKDLLPVERHLAGDFFCAPFGASDVEPAPAHGWTANSRWDLVEQTDASLTLKLRKTVLGSNIHKVLRPATDAPLLYQTHLIKGGAGSLTVAHHPMVRVGSRGCFSCSPKRAVLAAEEAFETGRNRLELSARTNDLTCVAGTNGLPVDLTHLPIGDAHEDFVTLVEDAENTVGWSAVLRDTEDDIVFILKDPRVLPVTMLWHSNGGRDYAPWNGRHRGVLGIEDGCAAGASGHAAALVPNAVSAEGVSTALALGPDRVHRIAHVIGAVQRPSAWSRVSEITLSGAVLTITGDAGDPITLPFDPDFFREIA